MNQKHEMKLRPEPFVSIRKGYKTIELRLNDEKRQKVKVGDKIIFTNISSGEECTVIVEQLYYFDSFDSLYKSLPLLKCGYTIENIENAAPIDMEQYYSIEEQSRYGVVGIEISLIK